MILPLPADTGAVAATFRAQDAFIALPGFLNADAVAPMIAEANALRARINRNFVPGIKKGGSVSWFDVMAEAPAIRDFYRSDALLAWLRAVTGEALVTCPDSDPHACALYYYTEAGDHIGWHYDTSFYRGKRFTVLLGLVQRSRSELVARLHYRTAGEKASEVRLSTEPGLLVAFDGDRCWHKVTPSGDGDDRVVLSMEYVTDRRMGALPRLVSNVKDAVAYFGIRGLLRGRR
ncbi:MAG: 2OG-Fe(II) oxygenase [Gemmatimonadota bacterium]|nr:2OG-Fe(II) oxygenase [Gemmatimonadota bacterium]